ncbi:MAG: antiterminator LoaP [Rectinemataceae bacterium]|jgi:transcriptional antiterminator NusG
MQYYTIHVLTTFEDDFARRLIPVLGPGRLIIPKKMIPIRRGGDTIKNLMPVFPGYIFIDSEDILGELDAYWTIRKTPGFIRFLRDSSSPTPLSDHDVLLLRRFISFGEYADTSKVTFDEHDRIVVLEGPLKGLEGQIIKVNRRKGRAKVLLDMYGEAFPIDLGFEVVERVKGGGGTANEEYRA